VQELLEYTFMAFDLADKYRTPVCILGDGLLGQMMEPLTIPANLQPKTVEKPWALTGCKGRRPNILRSLLLAEGALEEHNRKLQAKYAGIKAAEVRAQTFNTKDADVVLVAYGSIARMAKAAMDDARAKGLKVGMIRPITLWPFPEQIIQEAAARAKKFLVVEMSAGQMVEDVRLAVNGKSEVHFHGRMGGGIPSEEEILSRIEALYEKK
jgi:2-oxoglutarate ferredoxin oxidoreductase subunit alpha